jgi:hypothetical protein
MTRIVRHGGKWAALALGLAVLGCDARPRAPALQEEPIYQNTREGFRFLAPEGWTVQARADVPAGRLEKERLLVLYSQQGATLQVSMADLPESSDLAEYLAVPAFGVAKWEASAPPASLQLGGQPAVRYQFKGRAGKDPLDREVIACRHGERVYFFTILTPAGDSTARDVARRAIESTTWKK